MAEETTMSMKIVPETASDAKPPAPGQETQELMKRAKRGDRGSLPEIRALLADGDRGLSFIEAGSPAEWLRQSLIRNGAGENLLGQEAVRQKLASIQRELEGPDPTPIERLLAERAALCWFIVNQYENAFTNSEGWTIDQADFHHRKIDRAHSRFLLTLRTLAQIRKLALPTFQVNIARNQVNVARSQG
jgi:hypothetical protein